MAVLADGVRRAGSRNEQLLWAETLEIHRRSGDEAKVT